MFPLRFSHCMSHSKNVQKKNKLFLYYTYILAHQKELWTLNMFFYGSSWVKGIKQRQMDI